MTDTPSAHIFQVKNLFARKKHAAALQACSVAVAEWPDNADLLILYGELLMQLSRPEEAEGYFRRVLAYFPERPDVLNRLAAVLLSQVKPEEAEQVCRQALLLAPGNAETHANMGNIQAALGNMDAAAVCYQHALEIMPGFIGAWLNLGNAYKAQYKYAEAEACYLKVLDDNPRFLAIYIGLAECCLGCGEPARALQYYESALAIDPAFLDAHLNRAVALSQLGMHEAALASLDSVQRLDPEHVEALFNRGLILKRLGQYDQAADCFATALAIQPGNLDIQASLSLLELLRGHYADGWRLYTARKSVRKKNLVRYEKLPADLTGKHVLLRKDQGLGDEIFFLRFATELKMRGAFITYQADRKINSLLGRVGVLDRVLPEGEPVGASDYSISVGDLPYLLGFDEHMPLPPPLLLSAVGERIQVIREWLEQAGPPPRIGITWWAGTRNPENTLSDRLAYREVPLDELAEVVLDTAGTLVVLQRSPDQQELDRLRALSGQPVLDASAQNDNLEDMLALLGLLEDYVGVDNTNMHLAAGIGKPCRILVPHPPEWRMQTSGVESCWFPGFRLYRQDVSADWQPALDALQAELTKAHGKQQ